MTNQILENSTVRLTTVATVIVVIAAYAWSQATWQANTTNQLRLINKRLERLEDGNLGVESVDWMRNDMREWQYETEEKNPDWRGAPIRFKP